MQILGRSKNNDIDSRQRPFSSYIYMKFRVTRTLVVEFKLTKVFTKLSIGWIAKIKISHQFNIEFGFNCIIQCDYCKMLRKQHERCYNKFNIMLNNMTNLKTINSLAVSVAKFKNKSNDLLFEDLKSFQSLNPLTLS